MSSSPTRKGATAGENWTSPASPAAATAAPEDDQKQTDRLARIEKSFEAGITLQRDDDDDRNTMSATETLINPVTRPVPVRTTVRIGR